MEYGTVGFLQKVEQELPNPLEKHTADSKWQFCDCETCQRKRLTLDALPGKKIDYATFRHVGEKY